MRHPNEALLSTPLEQLYSDCSEPVAPIIEPQAEQSGKDLVETLEHLTDELTSALNTAQRLHTDFALEVEYCQMDGEPTPTEFDDAEKKKLKSAIIATREALNLLEQLEGGVKS